MRRSWAKRWAPYRSGLEASVAKSLEEAKVEFGYESETIQYRKRVVKGVCDTCGGNKTSQKRTYRPDFILGLPSRSESGVGRAKVFIEVKGNFTPADRAKMVAVKQDNPELDIRLIFGANNKVQKNKNERYSDWADKHGFPYFVGKYVPNHWLRNVDGAVQAGQAVRNQVLEPNGSIKPRKARPTARRSR